MGRAVTMGALIKRINRALEERGEYLKTLRGDKGLAESGRYYIIEFTTNTIVAMHVDPVELGRELGVVKAGESIAEG